MKRVRRFAVLAPGLFVIGTLAYSPAAEPSDSIANWAAPAFWMPPLARDVAAWKEQGLLPEGADAVEGLPSSALPFFAIVPCRIVDTRPAAAFPAGYGAPAMVANASRDFDLNSAAHCPGIPANAEAYSINVTVTETTGLGDVRIWPAGSPPAVFVSTQNWPTAGLSLANAAVVPAGTGGAITVFVAGSSTHLIVDINGYYAPISIVNTVNTLSGAVNLAAGSNISITPSGNTLTIASSLPTGNITSMNAGTGLTGGGTSGDVTLNVALVGAGLQSTVSRSDHKHTGPDITSGTMADALLGLAYSNALTFSNPANVFNGTFTGNASGLTAVKGLQRPPFSITGLDTAGIVGEFSSVAIGADGLGLISYYSATNGDLKVAHCSNVGCTSATITPLDSAGDVGSFTSVAIGADGLGLISYLDETNADLKVAHCSNVNCTSATITTLDSAGFVGFYTSVATGADGLVLISYYDSTNEALKVAHCDNLACTSATITTLDGANGVGFDTSVAIGADGLGLISYYDDNLGNLKVAHCDNLACTSATITPLDTAGDVGAFTSVRIGADGLGLISYYDATNFDLKVAHCDDLECTDATITPLDTVGDVGIDTSITIAPDGLPLISYHDFTNADLKVAHCSNVTCSAATLTAIDTLGSVGVHTSMTVGTDGMGLISYRSASTSDLRVAHCSNALCTPFARRR